MSLVKTSPSDELSELVENINAALNSIHKNSQHIMGWVHTIKTKELWRSTAAKTFSQFCEMQDWTPRRFNQLAAGYETLLTIPKEMGTMVPTERHLRELAKAPEKEREKVVKETKKRDGKVTAKGIEKTVEEQEYEPKEPEGISEPEPEVVRDVKGWPIPKDLIPLWLRREELETMMAEVSRLKCIIEKGQAAQDPLFMPMSNGVIAELQGVRWALKHARPWIVCTVCEGRPNLNGSCSLCKSTGFLLERDCDTLPTVKDVLKIREKVLAQGK